jgi:hypothetical protein
MAGQRTGEALSGLSSPNPNAAEFAVVLAGVLLLVLLVLIVGGLIVLIAEQRRSRGKSLTDREAETFAAAVAAGDFDAAERSLRWALALASRPPGPAEGAGPAV